MAAISVETIRNLVWSTWVHSPSLITSLIQSPANVRSSRYYEISANTRHLRVSSFDDSIGDSTAIFCPVPLKEKSWHQLGEIRHSVVLSLPGLSGTFTYLFIYLLCWLVVCRVYATDSFLGGRRILSQFVMMFPKSKQRLGLDGIICRRSSKQTNSFYHWIRDKDGVFSWDILIMFQRITKIIWCLWNTVWHRKLLDRVVRLTSGQL